MNNLWLRIKIWFKVTLVTAGVIYIIVFTYKNASKPASFWYWYHREPQTTLLLLVLCAFLAGIVSSFLVRTTFRTIRQIQQLQDRSRTSRLDREMSDIRTKAAMLQTKAPATPASSAEDKVGDE